MAIKSMKDLDLSGRTVVVREDLNVSMKDGRISSDKRIRAALPTLKLALEKGAGVVVLSHLGRPRKANMPKSSRSSPWRNAWARLSALRSSWPRPLRKPR